MEINVTDKNANPENENGEKKEDTAAHSTEAVADNDNERSANNSSGKYMINIIFNQVLDFAMAR